MKKETSWKYSLPVRELSKFTEKQTSEIVEQANNIDGMGRITSVTKLNSQNVRKLLTKLGLKYNFKAVAFSNLKGGVGKTVSAINLASRAVQYGFKTCILDMDSQGSATTAFNCEPDGKELIFYDVWKNPEELTIEALKKIEENFFILPSSLDNGLLDSALVNPTAQKNAVRSVCKVLKDNKFDLVVIDCPPSLGAAVISSISAADVIVIPLTNDSYSAKGLRLTLSEIESISEVFGLNKPDIHILFTRFDLREKLTLVAWENLKNQYPDYLLDIVIPTSTKFARMLENNETIFASSDAKIVRDRYDSLTRTLLDIKLK